MPICNVWILVFEVHEILRSRESSWNVLIRDQSNDSNVDLDLDLDL